MKITAVFLTVFCLHVSAGSHSQTITLSIKGGSLEKVFSEIEKQTNYHFAYRWELLQKAKPVDLQVNKASIKEVLDICFKEQVLLTYQILDNTIIIKEKASAAVNNTSELPPLGIKGKVIDEKGKPVSGASVSVKGNEKLTTTTNENGEFFLNDITSNVVLTVSHVGYETKDIKPGNKNDVIVVLVKDVVEMNEVEISYGIAQKKRKEFTGPVGYLDSAHFNRTVSSGVIDRINSMVPFVLFDKSAENDLNIRIGPRATIYATTQPLIYVDNFPYSGDINLINPNDVESISILKEATGASVSGGPQSANGVIVITTRKGSYNKGVSLDFNSNITVGEKPDLFYDRQFLNSPDFINVEKFLFDKGFYDPDLLNTTEYTPVSPVVSILAQRRAGAITDMQMQNQIDALRGLDIRNDYNCYFYRPSVTQRHGVSLRGGSNKANYYFSAGYDNILDNVIGNQSKRMSLNTRFALKPVNDLEISGQIVFTHTRSENNGIKELNARGNYSNIYPYAQLADANGNPLSVIKDYSHSFASSPPVAGLLNWQYYPLIERDLNDLSSKGYDTRIVTGIKYSISKGGLRGLNAEIKFQFHKGISESKNFHGQETYYTRNLINIYSTIISNVVTKRNIPPGAIMSNSTDDLDAMSGSGQISYDRKSGDHSISIRAGIQVNESRTNGNSATIYGYDPDNGSSISVNYDSAYRVYPNNAGARIPGSPGVDAYTLNRTRAIFGTITYIYRERYTIYGSVRSDQSNLFGVRTNQKILPLWSVGTKWDISKEKFYNISWLKDLSLRVNYGFTGNVDKSIAAFTIARFSTGSVLNSRPYVSITSPGNPDLRWEKIGTINTGIMFVFGKGAVSGSIDYYHKNGTDLLGDATVPSYTGYNSLRGNYSAMVAHGFDLAIHTTCIKSRIKWETDFSFSHTVDRITKNEGNTMKVPGRPVSWTRSLPWGGLDGNGDPLGYLNGTPSKNYSAIISAASSNPGLYLYDGPTSPQIYGYIMNTISWKQFSVSANISYKAVYYFKRTTISYSSLYENSSGHVDFLARWQKPGDETITSVPSMVYPVDGSRDGFYSLSEVLVERGDHIRLRDLNINYSISKKEFAKLPFYSMQLYFYANNLGIIWRANKKGIDPDYRSGYPDPRTFSFGVRASL